MKVKASIRKICAKCKMLKRGRRIYVVCQTPKHKQKQG